MTRMAVSVLVLLLAARAAHAERVPVDCLIEAGLGGVVRGEGGVFPVSVMIDNKVAGTTGKIEIIQPDYSGGTEVRQSLSFVTPAPSVKKFTLLARMEDQRDLEVRVLFRDHIRNIRKKMNVVRSRDPLAVCVGMPRTGSLAGTAGKYRFVNIGGESMPVDPVALDGAHAVMVSGPGFAMLDRQQVKALRQWTLTGGTLIFHDPSPDQAFIRNLDIVAGGRSIDVSRRGLTYFGAGVIASSGTDPQPALVFWDNDEKLKRILFPESPEEDENESQFGYGGVFTGLWGTTRSYGTGNFFWLAVIIGIYVCIIGPFDRWIVRRMGRPYMTWAFFGATIGAFSLLAYKYSSFVNVGDMRAVRVNIVDTACDADTARGNSFFWIYSVKNAAYHISSPLEDVCFSGRESRMGAGAIARVDVMNARESSISARIPVFSAKVFDAAWYAPWAGQITFRGEGSGLEVSVPRDINVKKAFLAGREGLETLSARGKGPGGANTFRPGSSNPVSWEKTAAQLSRDLTQHWQFGWQGPRGGGDTGIMPADDILRAYLIYMSYPWRPEKSEHDSNMDSLRQARDFREKSLDIRGRLSSGRTLLLFLGPPDDLFPLKIRGYRPRTAEVNLVRIQVPDPGL